MNGVKQADLSYLVSLWSELHSSWRGLIEKVPAGTEKEIAAKLAELRDDCENLARRALVLEIEARRRDRDAQPPWDTDKDIDEPPQN